MVPPRRAQKAFLRTTEPPSASKDVQLVSFEEQRIREREVGPVTVAVLDAKPAFAPSGTHTHLFV